MSFSNFAPLLGLLGSITAASLFFPQVLTSYKTKKTQDLSWMSIILGLLNGAFWFSYGVIKTDPFIYITNALLFSAVFLLMLLKRKYG